MLSVDNLLNVQLYHLIQTDVDVVRSTMMHGRDIHIDRRARVLVEIEKRGWRGWHNDDECSLLSGGIYIGKSRYNVVNKEHYISSAMPEECSNIVTTRFRLARVLITIISEMIPFRHVIWCWNHYTTKKKPLLYYT